jgi:acyl-homoserine lactone acylase PvdQ
LPDCKNTFGLPESADSLPPAALKTLHANFLAAVDSMLKRHGTVSIEWSAINAIELADGRKFPCGVGDGSVQTVWQGSKGWRAEDGTWRVGGGSDFMMATEMSDPPVVHTLVPYGQSDDPESPHFADQTQRWIDGKWKRAWFTLEDVERESKSKKKLAQ